MDIRLYNRTGIYEDYTNASELTSKAKSYDANATGIEVIGNKVVKYLLTYKGTDALDPDYGGVALHYGQISKAFMPRFSLEMHNDVQRCKNFIRKTQRILSDSYEKMSDIILKDIRYNPSLTPDRVDVYIEIITTKNNRAIVAVSNKA